MRREDIFQGISAAVTNRLPEAHIYDSLTTRGFQRPAVLVELEGVTMDTRTMGARLVGLHYRWKLTGLVEADGVHHSHLPTLDDMGMELLGVFADGYIKAGDRCLQVASCIMDSGGYDNVVVRAVLDIVVERDELSGRSRTERAEMMERVEVKG